LTDPSKTTDLQLGNLATKLRDIMRARREAHGLPIDYEQLRQETIVTMEYALGKKLIPKETADSQAGLIHEKYQELLLNRVSKIANEKLRLQKRETDLKKNEADLESRKDELALAKAEFQNASNEKLLTLALGQFRSGLINVFTCQNCGCIFAYQLGKKGSATYRMICPCCLVGPVRQRNKWPNEKVTVSS
jgi:rubrerythrin